ncbi:hypothetical protein [Haloarchaeobius sp. TZWSO28]|uniref:hypothetical protein n=1 Tax=Haloarchaeobius sp. TZWSO28 TaxID=3446119 RepID=UPI003EBC2EC6
MEDSPTVGFRWDEEEYDEFKRTIARLKGEGKIPTSKTQSDVIRGLLRNWMEDPDLSRVDFEDEE